MESEHSHTGGQPQPAFPLPGQMPVMVLPNCFLLPGCFLPLFIFEDRYRQMLAHALKTDRMFCVGIRKSTCDGQDEVLPVTTAGLIRACVRGEDGTSQLMLHGLQRIRITGWAQEQPFRIAEIEPVITAPFDCDYAADLQRSASALLPPVTEGACDATKIVRAAIDCVGNPELVCDILAYHFVKRACTLKSLLFETCLVKRYSLLISELKRMTAD